MRPIDADALLKKRRNFGKEYSLDPVDKNVDDQLIDLRHVLKAPTLDYAPVIHSQWLLHEMNPKRVTVDGYVVCLECKHHFDRIKGTWFKRCPNCGAHMTDGGLTNEAY